MQFVPTSLTDSERALQHEIRDFLIEQMPRDQEVPAIGFLDFAAQDADFTRRLGERGFVGRRFPERYGGFGGTAVETFLINEEVAAVNAPVGLHYVMDRQIGPCILNHGSEYLRERFLHLLPRGEVSFAVGFSEPDAGSDLAAVRTRAVKVDGGWIVNGTKVWTSNAHLDDYFAVLCRTSPAEDRHQGLSQLIVDLRAPGVQVNPILLMEGTHHFNEVVLTDVFVPDNMVLGDVGMGWSQATAELGYERASPDKYLSGLPVLRDFIEARRTDIVRSDSMRTSIGELVARLWGIRHMSLSLARSLDQGLPPGPEVALAKDLGTALTQDIVETARALQIAELDPTANSQFEARLAKATMFAPIATIGGGTSEILRSIAAKALRGFEHRRSEVIGDLFEETAFRLFRERLTLEDIVASEDTGWSDDLWKYVSAAGLPWVGVPEEAGGSGGTFSEALAMLRWSGYYSVPLPLAETGILAGWLLAGARLVLPDGPCTVAPGTLSDNVDAQRRGDGVHVSGVLHRVPWGGRSERVVALAPVDGQLHVLSIKPSACHVKSGRNIAGEPRDQLTLSDVVLGREEVALAGSGVTLDALRIRGALVRAVQIVGACQAATDLTIDYAGGRIAFGRPIAAFQAVQHHLVRAAGETELASLATTVATHAYPAGMTPIFVAAAKVIAGRAARTVAAAAHQVHGSIGLTREYELHPRTRRLWSWSHEFGSERAWGGVLGAAIAEVPADALWPFLSAEPGDAPNIATLDALVRSMDREVISTGAYSILDVQP